MKTKVHFRQLIAEQLERRDLYAADISFRMHGALNWGDHDFQKPQQPVARFADQSLNQRSDHGERRGRPGDHESRPLNSGPQERSHFTNFGAAPRISFSRDASHSSQPEPRQRRSDPPSGESPSIGQSSFAPANQAASINRDFAKPEFVEPSTLVIVRITPQFSSVTPSFNAASSRVPASAPVVLRNFGPTSTPKLNANSADPVIGFQAGVKSNPQLTPPIASTGLPKVVGNLAANDAVLLKSHVSVSPMQHSFDRDGSLLSAANANPEAGRSATDSAMAQTGLIELAERSLDGMEQLGKQSSQPWKLSNKTLQGLKAIGQGTLPSLNRNQRESANDLALASWFSGDLGLIELDIQSSRPINQTLDGYAVDQVAAQLDSVMGLHRFVETLGDSDDANESPNSSFASRSELVHSFTSLTNSQAFMTTERSDHGAATTEAVSEEEPRFQSFFKQILATSLLTLLSSRLLRKRGNSQKVERRKIQPVSLRR